VVSASDGRQIRVKLLDESHEVLASATQGSPPPTDGANFMVGGFLVQIDALDSDAPDPSSWVRIAAPKPAAPTHASAAPAPVGRERPRTIDEIMEFFKLTDGAISRTFDECVDC
jgi:hypothetical protein